MFRQRAKDLIGQAFSKYTYPIIVNSYGRSGSTVLTKSIVECGTTRRSLIEYDLVKRSILQSAWDLENSSLKKSIVYKTHDYPPGRDLPCDARMLYTYADPVDVVLSLLRLYEERGEWWMKEHYRHLQVPYPEKFNNIIKLDQLRLENHLESWLQEERFPIAFIRYESMWDYQEKISDFLGFDVQLLPFKERKAGEQKDEELISELKNTYAGLRKKIDSLPPYFVKNAVR